MVKARERLLNEKEITLSFLEKIASSLHARFDLEQTLGLVMQCTMASSHASAGAIFLYSEDRKYLQAEVVVGIFPPLKRVGTSKIDTKAKYIRQRSMKERIMPGEGLVGRVAVEGETILIKNARRDIRATQSGSDLVEIDTMLVCPMKIKDAVAGVIALVNKKDGSRFNEADDSMVRALAAEASMSINTARLYKEVSEKEILEKELEIAREIQEFLLPKKFPEISGVKLASLCRAAKEVGGDYYDVIQLGPDSMGIIIADVSGKGVPGALVMAMLRSTLRSVAPETDSPRETLIRVNRLIADSIRDNMFITLYYAVINVKEGIVRYCRAGHDPVIVIHGNGDSDKGYSLLEGEGICIGLADADMFDMSLKENEARISPGDSLFFYTDGATEAMNIDSEEFGFDNLVKVVMKNSSDGADAIIHQTDEEIKKFVGKAVQHDDLTMIAVEVGKGGE